MSLNLSNVRILRALSKALTQEGAAAFHAAEVHLEKKSDSNARGEAEAARLLVRLSSACNEAAEDLHKQDRAAIEAMMRKPDDPAFDPKGKKS